MQMDLYHSPSSTRRSSRYGVQRGSFPSSLSAAVMTYLLKINSNFVHFLVQTLPTPLLNIVLKRQCLMMNVYRALVALLYTKWRPVLFLYIIKKLLACLLLWFNVCCWCKYLSCNSRQNRFATKTLLKIVMIYFHSTSLIQHLYEF